MTPSKLAFLILEARTLENLQQKVRSELINERLLRQDDLTEQQRDKLLQRNQPDPRQ